jgi:hypothetical protein
VPVAPFRCCLPWHARHWHAIGEDGPETMHGGACCFCDRAIAVPESARGKTVACTYCGMERGFEPAAELPPFATSKGTRWA